MGQIGKRDQMARFLWTLVYKHVSYMYKKYLYQLMNMAIFFSKSQCLYYHIKVFLIHINKVYWPQFVLYIIRSLSNSTDNYLLLPIIASTDNYFLRYQ
jgi:hypothetical protein